MQLEHAAKLVANEYSKGPNGTENLEITPEMIALFIELIPILLETFSTCVKAREIPRVAKNMNWIQALLFGLTLRKHMGHKLYRKVGEKVSKALLLAASKATPDEMEALFTLVD